VGMWSAVCATLATAAGAGVVALSRAFAFQLRERSRRKTMAAVLGGIPQRGGSVQVTEECGITWTVRSRGWEGDGAG
jgi:hypothetical protein